jgi:hypothetical protein
LRRNTTSKPLATPPPGGKDPLSGRPFLFSFLASLFLFVLCLWNFRPYFQLNDDTWKVFFAEGVGTDLQPSEFIGYSNVLLGFLLKGLYQLTSKVQWYTWYLLAEQFLGFWAVLACLLLGSRPRLKAVLFIGTCFAVNYYYFDNLQYTFSALWACQGGLFLTAALWEDRSARRDGAGFWLVGGCLLSSSFMRLDALALGFLNALPLLVLTVLQARPLANPAKRGLFVRLGALVFIIAACAAFNGYYNDRDAGWREFNRFNAQRMDLMDYKNTPYDQKTKPFFDSAGWSHNDYEMFKGWYFMDEDLYDWRNLQKLAGHFPRFTNVKPDSPGGLEDILDRYFPMLLLLLLLSCALFVQPARLPLLLGSLAWTLFLLEALIYLLRAPERIYLPMLSSLLNLSIFLAGAPGPASPRGPAGARWKGLARTALACLSFTACVPALMEAHAVNLYQRQGERTLQASVASLNPRDDQLYVVWDSSFPFEVWGALDDFRAFRSFHLVTLAPFERSPHAQAMMRRFGLKHLLRDMTDRPNVFLICNQKEGLQYSTYMMEHYGLPTGGEPVFKGFHFNVFRLHTLKTRKGQ